MADAPAVCIDRRPHGASQARNLFCKSIRAFVSKVARTHSEPSTGCLALRARVCISRARQRAETPLRPTAFSARCPPDLMMMSSFQVVRTGVPTESPTNWRSRRRSPNAENSESVDARSSLASPLAFRLEPSPIRGISASCWQSPWRSTQWPLLSFEWV